MSPVASAGEQRLQHACVQHAGRQQRQHAAPAVRQPRRPRLHRRRPLACHTTQHSTIGRVIRNLRAKLRAELCTTKLSRLIYTYRLQIIDFYLHASLTVMMSCKCQLALRTRVPIFSIKFKIYSSIF